MATADELLSIIDTDKTLIIDKDLRTITIPYSVKNLGVESDDDVLRLKFSMPRMYGDVDLSDFSIYINYINAKNVGDVYIVDDKTIADDTITFSWLVGRVALAYKGNVRFIVCMKKHDNDSNIIQEYNTTIASLPVLEGLETGETIVQQYPDIIEMLLSSSGTTDHSQLNNRDIADQHPISAITGLEEALTPLTGTTETLTPTQVYDAIKSGKSVLLQHTNSLFGLFTFASFNIFEKEKVVVSTSIGKTGDTYLASSLAGFAGSNEWVFNITEMAKADDIPVFVNNALAQAKESGEFDGAAGKSAYAYAQDGGYTGTEEQFAAKLAKEKFANPYALTFTGAVEGSYDGSAPVSVEIPGGGTGGCYLTVETITIGEGPGKTVKVNLATLELTNGLTHKNGTLNTGLTDGYTVEIPYIDGMRISTGTNPAWIANYPPFIVLDNGSYTVPEYTTGDVFPLPTAVPTEYTCVLSGYSTSAKVYVNLYAKQASMAQIEATDKYWYSYEN